jgi:hypothetical protein
MLMAIRNEGRTLERDVVDLTRASKRVGTIVRDLRHIVVKIQAGTLTEDQKAELEQYVRNLVAADL